MAYTSDQLAALEAAIAQGALVVQYADKRVEYRSLVEMQQIRRQMRTELGLDSGAASKGRRFAEFHKGV
jgi:hypothetical protein